MKSEVRKQVLIRDFFSCQRCGKSPGVNGLQIAHRIKSGTGTEKYIQFYLETVQHQEWFLKDIREKIIDHPLNLVTTCSLSCNDSFNIFNNPEERDRLINKILINLVDADF